MLRKHISAMLAVQLLVCSATSYAETEAAAENAAASAAAPAASAAPASAAPATPAQAAPATPAQAAPAPAAPAQEAPAAPAQAAPAAPSAADDAVSREAETAAPSQPSNTISSVRVKGNRRIESAAIMQAVRVRGGDQLDPETVDADVRAIYRLGHFTDVQAQLDSIDGATVLEYVVQEKPVVREIRIDGAKELSSDKVREAIDIKPNSIYSPKELQKSIKKVKKLYSDEGYYLAEVAADTSKRSESEVNLHFRVKEGEKVLIRTIAIEGNRAFKDKKLKKAMETSEKWMFSWLTGAGTYKEEVLKNDVALITDMYMNQGYVNVKVAEPKVDLLPDKSGLKVKIEITEGEQYRIGTLGFRGELLESTDVLMGKLKEKSGELFSRNNLRADVFGLTDLYADKGYAFANATPLTKLNPESRTIDITFDMEKGELVHIDRINISGNPKTRDKVIRRELRLVEGDLYSASGLKRSKQNVMNTGFFEEANLVTVKGSAPDKLDLNVQVKEKPTGTFSIGAGYSSLDGIIGQGSVQQANFLGLGLKLSAAASLGSRSQTYNLGLTDPYFLDTKWTIGGDLYRNDRDYLDYTRRATGGDIKAGYALSDTLSTFWLYKYEQKEIYDESAGLRNNIGLGTIVAPEKTSTTSAIQGSLSRNTTDYRPDPTTGWMNMIQMEFAGLGGSNRYLRGLTEHTFFVPVPWGGVASARGTFGYIQELGREIPIDERFYLGGINSLRGYSSRTVSPNKRSTPTTPEYGGIGELDDSRVYLGGEMEAVMNLEYSFPILKEAGLKGVIFFDAGNSDNTFKDTFGNILASYGAGFRWFSPIGPLRLEYGIPINPRDGIDKSSGRLEFSIGSIF